MKSYHFSFGNSARGPIGFCARIKAESRAEAVKKLRKALPEWKDVRTDQKDVEYLTVYFNEDAVTEADIDDEEEEAEGGQP